MIWRCALAMEDVDAAASAEMMDRAHAVPLVGGEQFATLVDGQGRFRHLPHDGVALHAQRAVAGRQLGDLMVHREADATTVARADMPAHHLAMPSR